jgi:hypothetical protein
MSATFLLHPQRVGWRVALFQVHLWIGLLLGIYVCAVGISDRCRSRTNEDFESDMWELTPRVALEWDRFVSRAKPARNTLQPMQGSSARMPRRKPAGLAD